MGSINKMVASVSNHCRIRELIRWTLSM